MHKMSEEKNRYRLSLEASTDLMTFRDWEAVAKDLENMVVGQRCLIYTHYPGSVEGMPPKIRADSYGHSLNEALGDRKDNYEMIVEASEEIKGGWKFSVERIK